MKEVRQVTITYETDPEYETYNWREVFNGSRYSHVLKVVERVLPDEV